MEREATLQTCRGQCPFLTEHSPSPTESIPEDGSRAWFKGRTKNLPFGILLSGWNVGCPRLAQILSLDHKGPSLMEETGLPQGTMEHHLKPQHMLVRHYMPWKTGEGRENHSEIRQPPNPEKKLERISSTRYIKIWYYSNENKKKNSQGLRE